MRDGESHLPSDGKAVVAQSSILTVEACACGVMHLHFGPMTMRFTEEGLASIRNTISAALLRVASPEQAVERISPLFRVGEVRGEA